MRSYQHVIDSLTLTVTINGVPHELSLTSPAIVNATYTWQPAEEAFPAQAIVESVQAADVMLFDADGCTFCYAAGEEIRPVLPKYKVEQIEEAITASEQVEA